MRKVAIIFLFALLLQGCGHKGPLMLPPPDQPASQPGKRPVPPAEPQIQP